MAESTKRASDARDYRPIAAFVMAAIGIVLVLLPPVRRSDMLFNVFGVGALP